MTVTEWSPVASSQARVIGKNSAALPPAPPLPSMLTLVPSVTVEPAWPATAVLSPLLLLSLLVLLYAHAFWFCWAGECGLGWSTLFRPSELFSLRTKDTKSSLGRILICSPTYAFDSVQPMYALGFILYSDVYPMYILMENSIPRCRLLNTFSVLRCLLLSFARS